LLALFICRFFLLLAQTYSFKNSQKNWFAVSQKHVYVIPAISAVIAQPSFFSLYIACIFEVLWQKNDLQKRNWNAKVLYLHKNITNQKALAERVGTSGNTISKWFVEGKWANLKKKTGF